MTYFTKTIHYKLLKYLTLWLLLGCATEPIQQQDVKKISPSISIWLSSKQRVNSQTNEETIQVLLIDDKNTP